ncbi:EAL domain-containing protein [Thiomicrorhabdus sp.]|uniref:bifunctional diguanylate cyclase/phosphodiesterase n=1 Tax=Thiomicrorhabdus sp. TaxID=2039724 RepID=UPI003562A899
MIERRNSLKSIFVLVLLLFTLVFSGATAWLWQSTMKDRYQDLAYTLGVIKHLYIFSVRQRQLVLETSGERLLDMGVLHNPLVGHTFVDGIVKKTPEFVGLGLSDTNGQLKILSGVPAGEPLPNVLSNPKSAATFQRALLSQNAEVGETYYFDALKDWVLPVRFPIRDVRGDVFAVMTAGVRIEAMQRNLSNLGFDSRYQVQVIHMEQGTTQLFYPLEKTDYGKVLGLPDKSLSQRKSEGVNHGFSSFRAFGEREGVQVIGVEDKDVSYREIVRVYVPIGVVWQDFASRYWVLVTLYVLLSGLLLLLYRHFRHEQISYASRLIHFATHDELTDLPNRRVISEETEKSILYNQVHHCNNAVFYLDLDFFKNINDSYGHDVGDALLMAVSKRLQDVVGIENMVGRQGGDEFIVLLRTIKEKEQITRFAEQVIHTFDSPFEVRGITLKTKVSIGIAVGPEAGDTADDMMRRADYALYMAKDQGRSTFAYYSEDLNRKLKRRLAIESALSKAVENEELEVFYQAQVLSESKSVIGAEALVRWTSSDLGVVAPDEFIPIAEDIGLICQIDDFVLDRSFRDLRALGGRIGRKLTVAVNISSVELLERDIISKVERLLTKYDYDPKRVVLEITETALLQNLERALEVIQGLRSLGLTVSLDDFGTGYSSLSFLHRLPVSEIKIDRSFVRDILVDEHDAKLVNSIVQMGRALNIDVVAEGVETQEQYELLRSYQCDFVQGYWLSRPVKLGEFEQLVNLCEKGEAHFQKVD